jgi:hypothetical protein
MAHKPYLGRSRVRWPRDRCTLQEEARMAVNWERLYWSASGRRLRMPRYLPTSELLERSRGRRLLEKPWRRRQRLRLARA